VSAAGGLQIQAKNGRLDLTIPDTPAIHFLGLHPVVTYDRAGAQEIWRPAMRARAAGFIGDAPAADLSMRIEPEAHATGLILRTTLTNTGPAPLRLGRLAPIALDRSGTCQIGAGGEHWSVFRQGYQSWTGTRSFRSTDVDRDPWSMLLKVGLIDIHNPSPERRGRFRSDMFTLVKNLQSGEAFLAGFLTCRAAFGGVETHVDGGTCTQFTASLDYDDIPLAPGEQILAEPLWIAAGMDEAALLDAYASAVGAAMRARVPPHNPVGWCSWYYYFTHITEERIVENLRALTARRPQFPCDYVQVDDGYQAAIGDWLTPNEKFPRGMGWVAEQIRAAGFDAGIWTAPFIARSGSRLLAEHPDWFVQNARGQPRFALWNPAWGVTGNCYALDTTHPEVLDWLRRTFRTIAGEWGYRVLKLDFLFAAALPGRRYDPRSTRAAALRRGLEAIREAAGDDAFLLGCGCPLGPAIGVVDAMRIGPDVAPFWTNFLSRVPARDLHGLATKHAIRNTLTRAFLHRRWWLNDPDCLMVRDTKTQLTPDEVRSLATAIALTDGMLVLSDRVERLAPDRLDVLNRTMQLTGGRATVVDLMHADMPEILVSRSEQRIAVGVFNFRDAAHHKQIDLRSLGIDAGQSSATEFWSGELVTIIDGRVNLGEVPAHGCRVVLCTPAGEQAAGGR